MNFKKYFYGSRELVAFVDESGDPTLNDPNNPIFVLGLCAVYGDALDSELRLPWLNVRQSLTGSQEEAIHMKDLQRRIKPKQVQNVVDYFSNSSILRVSFAITDKTVFENGELPKSPVLELALENLLIALAELMNNDFPTEALSVIFENGPLVERMKPHWPHRKLTRSDGVSIPVSWSTLEKSSNEPGLEVADFIAHSATGYFRHNKSENSAFFKRYQAVHPKNNHQLHKGWELNKAELVSLKKN